MRNVAIAVFVVFVLGAVVVSTLSMFEVTKEAAKPLAGSLVAAIPGVHQLLQQAGSRLKLSARKRGVVGRDGYTMPAFMLGFYGLLIVFAVGQASSFGAGIAAVLAGVEEEQVVVVLALATVPTMIASYLVGNWIGIRSERRGLVAVGVIAFTVPLIDRGSLLIFASREHVETILHSTSLKDLLLIPVAVSGLLLGVPGVFGYWRGRVNQASRYLSYLLRALPQESRDVLVNLAYDEARRLASDGPADAAVPTLKTA